eukprot:1160062-Pelagomonas_calceolata.AAC.6
MPGVMGASGSLYSLMVRAMVMRGCRAGQGHGNQRWMSRGIQKWHCTDRVTRILCRKGDEEGSQAFSCSQKCTF